MSELNNIPKHWQLKKLGEVCTYSKGKKPKSLKKEKTSKTAIPYINIKAFEKGIFDEYTDGENCNLCNDGDLLMVWDGARCGLVGKARKGAVGSTLMKIEPKDSIHREFLFYFLQSKFYTLNTRPKGVGIPHIEPTLLWNFDLLLPPLPEQHAIVSKIEELFSELDKGKQQLETARQQLKTYRHSLLKAAFEGRLTNTKNIKWVKLGDVSKVSGGLTKNASKRNGLSRKVPFLRVANVGFDSIDISELHYVGISDIEFERVSLVKDDLLFVEGNGSKDQIGRVALWDASIPNCVHQNHLIKSRLSDQIIPRFALLYFCSSEGRKSIINQAQSTSGLHTLSLNKISNLSIPLPSVSEQIKILQELESKLTVCDKLEETITQSLQQVESLRQSILKKAFEGKLVNAVAEQKEAKVIPLYKPKSEYFYQMQLLGLVAKASKQKQIEHGEMTLAKYAYLIDHVYGVPTYFKYDRWHLGPYPPAIKKVINNKQYFKKSGNHIEVLHEKTLFNSTNPYTEKIQSAVNDLTDIFSKYTAKERSLKTELLATVCKVIEDIQSTDLKAVRQSMAEWKIDLKGEKHTSKADKFSELETEKCLTFINEKGWDRKLMK